MRNHAGAAGAMQCPSCQQACFCSPACFQAATSTPWEHSTGICRAYQVIGSSGLGAEDQGTLRFLTHALALREVQAQDPGQSPHAA
jgi:hypothetical protein